MDKWVNIVKRRLVSLNNQVKNMGRTECFRPLLEMAKNYRLLETQLALQHLINLSYNFDMILNTFRNKTRM